MSEQAISEQLASENESKSGWLSIDKLVVIITAASTLYFMHAEHRENMNNIQRTTQVLQKYERQLDLAISADKNVLDTYQTNLKKVLGSLDREQKLLLEQLVAIDKQTSSKK
jgi:hypothetical protein